MSQPSADRHFKAFDYAQDSAKQMLTLSVGILALTITFFKEFAGGGSAGSKTLLAVSWVFFLASIIAGILHLYALVGEIAPPGGGGQPDEHTGAPTHSGSIWNKAPIVTSMVQQAAFGIALMIAVAAGLLALSSSSPEGGEPVPTLTEAPAPDG